MSGTVFASVVFRDVWAGDVLVYTQSRMVQIPVNMLEVRIRAPFDFVRQIEPTVLKTWTLRRLLSLSKNNDNVDSRETSGNTYFCKLAVQSWRLAASYEYSRPPPSASHV